MPTDPDTTPDGRTEPAEPAQTLPEFTPVPRRFNRGDVWTEQVQRAFVEALADTASVEAACRLVGRSPASAYRLRRHPLAGEFAAAWQAAVDLGIQRIEDYAVDRAVNGVELTVLAHDGTVHTRRVYNDQLVMFMLRNRAPERYCAGGARALSAIDARSLARLKKQWRAEWERERMLQEDEEEQETLDSIDRFLEDMRERRLANEAILAEVLPEDEDEARDAPAGPAPGPTPPAEPTAPESTAPEPTGPRIRTLKGDWE